MNFFQFIFQDWESNKTSAKGRVIMLLFRIANFCTTRRIYYYLLFPYLVFYKILVEWFFSIEIPWNIKAGCGLRIYHGQGLVLNNQVVIGNYCTLRHCTTIGNKQLPNGTMSHSPVIGNYVDVGCNTCIIGNITIGDQVTIGCGSVVTKSVPANTVVAGNPAVPIRKLMQAVEVA
ncbi:serine acetyltransferase [Niastella vici]|uniref:Serine acetyltransferase n=1 Tax=Niastella vici TaxID=1703345 RepID=A0A1V9FYH4_9BACT|nr:serine acetyltransferase [Niastella vici]OQP63409.1 serine acetyltransferase [Niastella vici]